MESSTFIDSPQLADGRDGTQTRKSFHPTRVARLAMVGLLSLLPLIAAPPAQAGTLGLIEVQRDTDPGVDGLDGALGVAVSPDGNHVYVAGYTEDAIAVFSRDSASGELAWVEMEKNGVGGVSGLNGAQAVAVSPDGNHVYVAGGLDDALVVFDRDPVTGELGFVDSYENGSGGIGALDMPIGVAVSPDGEHVYVASNRSDSVTVFSRDEGTGELTWVEEHEDGSGAVSLLAGAETVVVSPDGDHVYVAAQEDSAVTVFSRDSASGELTFVEAEENGVDGVDGLNWVQGVTVSADGAHVYTASGSPGNSVAVFSRDETTGELTFIESHKDGVGQVDGLEGAEWVTTNPNGAYVYAISDAENTVVIFRRDPANGTLTFGEVHREGLGGIINALDGASAAAVSPDGVHLYVVADVDDAISVFGGLCGNGVYDAGEECDDGNVVDGDCCSSTCTNEAAGSPCGEDGNVCTDDKCNGVGLCLHVNNTAPCDDGQFCTINDVCAERVCVGTLRDCSGEADQCHDGVCDDIADACVAQPKVDGWSCDDGDGCTQSDTCIAGSCVGADPVICTALDDCHVAGECDSGTGLCSNPELPDGTACEDGDGCTQSDSCLAGVCVGADPVICTVLDQCHVVGACDPATGVCSDPAKADGTPCDDGDGCTQSDTCVAGVCVGADPVICTAADQCHVAGECDPATGLCSNPFKADGTPCDDESACTGVDTCAAGVCVGTAPVICTALDQCHQVGVCDPATGVCPDPAKPDGSPCDDGDGCTQSDTCIAGSCVGADPVICTALDSCHEAGECDSATGLCSNPELPDGTACDDGDACTQSATCAAGVCIGTDPVICTVLDQCHVLGECDPATGVCSDPAKPDGTPCDDASVCTGVDTCQAGSCVGADPVICTAADQCHQVGECDPATGVCSHPAKLDGAPCDDSDGCTLTDSCFSGVCVGSDPMICTALDQCHVAGECDSETGLCSNPEVTDGTPCDDASACTGVDTCAAGVCVGTDPVICTALDQCHQVGVCDPATGVCPDPAKADGTPCDDGDGCTQSDTCIAGSCVGADPVVCTALDQCHVAGECDPATGLCSDPEVTDGTLCDDGDACTHSDTCSAGICVGMDPVICTALDGCHEAGECDPATGICSNPEKPDGTALSFEAEADTHTDKDLPTDNFGESDELLLDGRPNRFVYLRFDVTGIGALPVQSAVIRLQTTSAVNAGSDHGGNMRAVSNVSWDELTLTHENRPDIDGAVLSSLGPIEPSETVEFDVTPAIASDGLYSFGIDAGSNNMAIFSSREADSGQPELIVTIATPCDDGDGCTQVDTCAAGVCVGTEPLICTALDDCHVAGQCDPATGMCSDPVKADGTPCDDADACTQIDSCIGGVCSGADPVICSVLDQCHIAGECDPATGVCSDPATEDGTPCDDGDACTQVDSCIAGLCAGAGPVICTAADQCHVAGECDPATGMCSDPVKADGMPCDDGDGCTQVDSCIAGVCIGTHPMICTAADQCHVAGECDPATGLCSDPAKADGTPCDDGDACTREDDCLAGICVGSEPAICTAADQCHVAGECDPATGVCSDPVKADGMPCDDADACTQTDSCFAGICSGGNPVICTAADQCHVAGECDPATGQCSDPVKADGSPCDDGDGCTQTDQCFASVCVGSEPVICTAADQCHVAGECDPATGQCSDPAKADGTPCDDADLCTQIDSCQMGKCTGTDPVLCPVADQCHDLNICDTTTGQCSDPVKANGSQCDDGNPCTQNDECLAGVCVGADPVICTPTDECHGAGTCDPATGQCSNPAGPDGGFCDDGDACTDGDLCFEGECVGEPMVDGDGDGFCDVVDSCPDIPDPAQADADGDGVGDLCQCTASAPGRCIGGGGSQRTDCFVEFNTSGPVTFNSRGTKVKPVLYCSDGDLACDLDGVRDGQCTFGVSLCFGNADPRYPRCQPATVQSMEVIRPRAAKKASLDSQANARQLEEALGALGLEVRRRGRKITESVTALGDNRCSPLVRLVAPAPKARGGTAVRRKFKLRAQTTNLRRDMDGFVLVCE